METKKKIVTVALASMLASSVVALNVNAASGSDMGECYGVNGCKGQGACKGKSNDCKGQNSCKGMGWVMMTKQECKDQGGKYQAHKGM